MARNLSNAPVRLRKGMERRLGGIDFSQMTEWDRGYLRRVIPGAESLELADEELLAVFKTLRDESGIADLAPIRHLPPGSLERVADWLVGAE